MNTTKNIVSKICSEAKKTYIELAGAGTDQKNNFLYDLANLIKENNERQKKEPRPIESTTRRALEVPPKFLRKRSSGS